MPPFAKPTASKHWRIDTDDTKHYTKINRQEIHVNKADRHKSTAKIFGIISTIQIHNFISFVKHCLFFKHPVLKVLKHEQQAAFTNQNNDYIAIIVEVKRTWTRKTEKTLLIFTCVFICIFTTRHMVQTIQFVNVIGCRNMCNCIHQKSPNLWPWTNTINNRNTGWPNKNRTFLRYHIFAATTDIIMRFLLKCWEITTENNKRQFF